MKYSKEIKAELIALLAIVGFVILFQFMKGKSLFTTDNIFYAKFDNVEGLEASNPVSINGLKVGQVDQIIPVTEKDGKIHFVVKVTVDDEFIFSKKLFISLDIGDSIKKLPNFSSSLFQFFLRFPLFLKNG